MNYELSCHKQAKAWAQKQRPPFRVLNRLKPGLRMAGLKKGFGLMEVLISAVIIIIILSALVTIGRAAMNNHENLAERTQAIYLAQEGIEMVRQIRDTNWIDGSNVTKWNTLNGSTPVTSTSKNYKPSFASSRWLLSELGSGLSEQVIINGVTFNRIISVVSASGILPVASGPSLLPYAIKATSTVTWTFSGQSKSIGASEILTNWRPDF